MAMNLRTPIGILSFPVVFTPRPVVPGGEPRFQINLLFDKDAQATFEFTNLKRGVQQAIDDEWGQGKSQDRAFVQRLRLPFRRCQDKQYKGYDIPGGVYITPWTKKRPGIVDANRMEITVPDDVWAGQLVRATVSPFAYTQSGNTGISFALNNIQICRTDGERLDGRKAATEDFDKYVGPGGAPADSDDDDIPF